MNDTINNRKKTTLAVAFAAMMCAAMLAFGLCAFVPKAHAATPSLSAGIQAAPTNVETAAAGKQVWVVSKVTRAWFDGQTYTFKYTYTKQGLLKKITNVASKEASVYAYDAKNRFRSMNSYGRRTSFAWDNKGRVSKTKDKNPVKYTYDAKGYLKKYDSTAQTSTYAYDKKGRLTKVVFQSVAAKAPRAVYKYAYDKHGQLKSVKGEEKATIQNAYDKNGRLVTQTIKSYGLVDVVTYSYKRVTVPKNLVKQVKAQQKSVYLHSTYFGVPIEAAYK